MQMYGYEHIVPYCETFIKHDFDCTAKNAYKCLKCQKYLL